MKDINMTLNTKGDPTQSVPMATSVKQRPSASAHGFMIRDILDKDNHINSQKPADQRVFVDHPLLESGFTVANRPTGGGAREYLDRQGTTLTMPTLNTATNSNDCQQQAVAAPASCRGRNESESVPVKRERKSSCTYPSHPSSKVLTAPLPPADDSDQETSTDHDPTGKKQRKPRTAFSDFQLQALEKSFDRQKYLSVQERMELAAKLNLADAQVKCWFQNRRTKWKRQHSLQFDSADFYPALHRMLMPGVGGLPFGPLHSSWPFAAGLPPTAFHGAPLSLSGYPTVSHAATPLSTSSADASVSSPIHRHLSPLGAPGSNSFSGQRHMPAASYSHNVYISQPSLSHGFL